MKKITGLVTSGLIIIVLLACFLPTLKSKSLIRQLNEAELNAISGLDLLCYKCVDPLGPCQDLGTNYPPTCPTQPPPAPATGVKCRIYEGLRVAGIIDHKTNFSCKTTEDPTKTAPCVTFPDFCVKKYLLDCLQVHYIRTPLPDHYTCTTTPNQDVPDWWEGSRSKKYGGDDCYTGISYNN